MDLFDIVLWIVFPYSVGVIWLMELIWKSNIENKKIMNRIKYFFDIFLLIFVLTGILMYFISAIQDDTMLIFHWIKGIFTLNPRSEMILEATLITKLHVISLFALLVLLPFSKKKSNRLHFHEIKMEWE